MADEQTAGRGRRGRVWFSPIGNLFCSILLDRGPEPARAPEIVFVAAVALREALEAVTPGATFVCKWPNDILCNGATVSGMLLEMAPPFVILGVGVNIVAGPPADMAQYPATCIADAGSKADAQSVCMAFGDRLAYWYDSWRADGFEPVRQAWLDRAAGMGKPITVRLADTTVLEGRFAGLDASGALLLDSADGTRRPVMAGDVFFAA
jgi:BirA family biotin operon repressor/biotin-[acetyl-CoA-carboxylase] ligase